MILITPIILFILTITGHKDYWLERSGTLEKSGHWTKRDFVAMVKTHFRYNMIEEKGTLEEMV